MWALLKIEGFSERQREESEREKVREIAFFEAWVGVINTNE